MSEHNQQHNGMPQAPHGYAAQNGYAYPNPPVTSGQNVFVPQQSMNTLQQHQMNNMEHAMNAMSLQQQMHNMHGHTQQQQRWNVDAPEFVPRTAAPAPQYYDYSSMYNGYNIADTYQHYPQPAFDQAWLNEFPDAQLEPQVQHSSEIAQAMQGPHGAMLMEVQVGIEQLITNSDDAEVWREAIVNRLTVPRTASIELMELVNKMIFETAAQHPNSVYTLSCLLQYMCSNPQLAEGFLMRCILPQARAEHERRQQLLTSDAPRARNFAQFLAEMYLRLTTRTTSARLEILRRAVFEQVDTLMRDTTNDENVITACRVVKTCGRALYEDDPDHLDEQIDRIGALAKNPPPTLTEPTKKQLTSIVTLHGNRWGLPAPVGHNKSSTSSVGQSPTTTHKNGTSTEGSNFLTEEERNFLESSLGDTQDDDADAAYEEFLKTTGA